MQAITIQRLLSAALWRSALASEADGLRSDFFLFFLFFFFPPISDLYQESDAERSGIIREYEEPYKCDIASAAVVVAAAAPGWKGGVRTMGR